MTQRAALLPLHHNSIIVSYRLSFYNGGWCLSFKLLLFLLPLLLLPLFLENRMSELCILLFLSPLNRCQGKSKKNLKLQVTSLEWILSELEWNILIKIFSSRLQLIQPPADFRLLQQQQVLIHISLAHYLIHSSYRKWKNGAKLVRTHYGN